MGKRIHSRGGFTAMQANFYTYCVILRMLYHRCEFDFNEEQRHIVFYNLKSQCKWGWEGVGDWIN